MYCHNQDLLPVGLSDKPNVDSVKLYCPCCKEIYNPPKVFESAIGFLVSGVDLDGAFFGTTFPHMFLLQYPRYLSTPSQSYEPTIFGYKIHQSRCGVRFYHYHVVPIMKNRRRERRRRRRWIPSDWPVCSKWVLQMGVPNGFNKHTSPKRG